MRRPPPVPPLADSALARIERGVFAALDARPLAREEARDPRWRVLALALAGAAAGAIFVARDHRHGDATSASTTQLTTTTSGSHIAVTGAALDVAPQSAVSFGAGRDGAFIVVLDRGTVTCEVAPRSNRAPFIVEAGETRVTVIGTRFSVHRVGAHATVSVEHGLVEVADTNMTELVHAGERFRPGEPLTREVLASEAPPAAVAVAPAPAAVAVAPAPAAVAVAAAPSTRAAALSPPAQAARAEHHRRVSVAASADVGAATTKPLEAVAATLANSATPASAATPEAPAAVAPAPPKVAAAPGRSVQVLFELAAQLEVRDPEAALRIYGELAAGDGGWAASALFASARLEGERGQPARAHALCETYLERFPRGPNADDARALLASSR